MLTTHEAASYLRLSARTLEALRKMDPRDWNGEHDAWLGLLTGCKYVGIAREEFVAW